MTAIATILLDSLRLLKARVLFWVTLGISVFVGILYLSIGFNETGMSMMFGLIDIEHSALQKGSAAAELVYVGIFIKFIIPIWITWVAIVLGLISTASIYPDFMSEGSIEISLSKPTRRLTIFLTKYLGSLLFMVIQVGLFTLLVFLALRWRVGTWNPSVFLMIPLATLVFSYLYCVVVLVTVRTRSSLAGILVALLVWLMSFLMNTVEGNLYSFAYTDAGATDPEMQEALKSWHQPLLLAYSILPKTKQTMEFGDRWISIKGEQGFSSREFLETFTGAMGVDIEAQGMDETVYRNGGFYIIGTSVAFEIVIVAMAAFSFCRRDF